MGNFFGIIIVRPLGLILMAIWSLVQNYGLALILFTLIVKLILLPFMYKQKKGMKKMHLICSWKLLESFDSSSTVILNGRTRL